MFYYKMLQGISNIKLYNALTLSRKYRYQWKCLPKSVSALYLKCHCVLSTYLATNALKELLGVQSSTTVFFVGF